MGCEDNVELKQQCMSESQVLRCCQFSCICQHVLLFQESHCVLVVEKELQLAGRAETSSAMAVEVAVPVLASAEATATNHSKR